MSESKIIQRIETNLFELPTKEFKHMSFEDYKARLAGIKPNKDALGRLIVKEYPPTMASVSNIEALLDELELKKKFVPNVVIVDYLSIMRPIDSRYVGMYEKSKCISEELRGIAVDRNLCVLTGMQTNRSGFSVSDFDLTSISECLDPKTVVDRDGKKIPLESIKVGDLIKGKSKDVKVLKIFPRRVKKGYEITTRSGKKIICSEDHKFPTDKGIKSIKNGLSIGNKLLTK
jgi:hypothetical protein